MITDELLQNLILLGATALLTGLVAPLALKRVDQNRATREREKEAQLARQGRVIEAQSKLLDDLSELLWRWRYLSMRVTYYGLIGERERYERAQDAYDTEFWDVFDAIRVQISRARRLASQHAYDVLLALYKEVLVELDKKLMRARDAAPGDQRSAFSELNRRIYEETSERIDTVLYDLARELGLSETAAGNGGGAHASDSEDRPAA